MLKQLLKNRKFFILFFLFLIFSHQSFAVSTALNSNNDSDKALFEKIFQEWTEGFNKKDISIACNLFSPQVKANYQGFPEKNYTTICNGFKKIFNEQGRKYQYHFEIQDIYRENDLAVVRITWYLQIYENDRPKPISITQDEGVDIFKKDENNQWKIINYLAYPVTSLRAVRSG